MSNVQEKRIKKNFYGLIKYKKFYIQKNILLQLTWKPILKLLIHILKRNYLLK